MSIISLDVLLESWDRQCQIVDNMSRLIDESNRKIRPAAESWPLDFHLAHIHEVRYGWLGQVSPEHQAKLGDVILQEGDRWQAIDSLDEIREQLRISGLAVREAVEQLVSNGVGPIGGYDHPIFFLQHMVWHEGWHVGMLMLGLRVAGQEPPDAWEEEKIWGLWRVE